MFSVLSKYFRTIDTWLPVVSNAEFQKGLNRLNAESDNDIATLLLSMHLITQIPSIEDTMRSPIYFDTKALFSLQVASGNFALEIAQAGLLIAVYEHGHGMTDAAQLTLAACARMAIKRIAAQRKSTVVGLQNTDVGRLWWGIVILDR